MMNKSLNRVPIKRNGAVEYGTRRKKGRFRTRSIISTHSYDVCILLIPPLYDYHMATHHPRVHSLKTSHPGGLQNPANNTPVLGYLTPDTEPVIQT